MARAVSIDGHRIELSRLDKPMFGAGGPRKGELVDYYRRIASTALPHYRGRMLSMQRFPDGIDGHGFFQKDIPDYFPEWIDRIELDKQDGTVTYAIVNRAATLVYLADQACITPHLSLSRSDAPHHPDRLIFDLDPSDEDFGKVRFAALALKRRLDALGLSSFLQTTGSRGLHVVVPLDRSEEFEATRAFARALAERLASEHPDTLTVEQRKQARGTRVFVDYLRNAYGQTAVAPYAVRAIEGAPIATPLRWTELAGRQMHARKYTMSNIFRRLGQLDDPWRAMIRCRQSLGRALERFERE